jgi:glycosyltransferase involved in cell wall biosynthesis
VHVVPNPVDVEALGTDGARELPIAPRTLVAMGRLARQKGFDVLLDAFARCAPAHPEWKLLILGEGEERTRLEAQVRALGLDGRVQLPGRVQRPGAILRRAELFVLPSRWEGFPNALLEAMACGVAAIAADCPSGPRDIVRPGVDGVLVPPEDPAALAAALDRLLTDGEERRRLAARAPEVRERFGLPQVMARWDALLGSFHSRGADAHQG